MRKLILVAFAMVIFLPIIQGQTTPPYPPAPNAPYVNLEKYWWYRYRLVNDFMLIGEDCGESIPVSRRQLGTYGKLKWADATNDLGHYLAMLGTEDKQLVTYGIPIKRTETELGYALDAYDRLDENAEQYSYSVAQEYHIPGNPSPLPGSYPCTITNYNFPPQNYKNGFFIRDDVPYWAFCGYMNQFNSPGFNNFKHFNRPGLVDPNYTGALAPLPQNGPFSCAAKFTITGIEDGAFKDRFSGEAQHGPTYPPVGVLETAAYAGGPWPGPEDPVPTEESQDQLAEIFTGLGLVTKYANSTALQGQAAQAAFRSISYPAHSLGWAKVNNLVVGNKWLIYNQARGDEIVYGVQPDKPYNITAGGAWMIQSAAGAAVAACDVAGGWESSSDENDLRARGYDPSIYFFFDFMQYLNQEQFTDNYVAFSANWANLFIFPFGFIPSLEQRNSWNRIWKHSLHNQFSLPHLPLIFELNYPSIVGSGFYPEDHGWPSYPDLFTAAPGCGIHNYNKDYLKTLNPNSWYWSGNDVLAEGVHRGGNDNSDCNGLDYMELFNLYCLWKPEYLDGMIDPYYMTNFNTNFPDHIATHYYNGVDDDYGSNYHRLTLNWLEYVSATNKITAQAPPNIIPCNGYDNGYVTYRGAKAILLAPGFQAQYGSTFRAYIHDYHITCDVYDQNGTITSCGAEASSFNFAEVCYVQRQEVMTQTDGSQSVPCVLGDSRGGTASQPVCQQVEYYPWRSQMRSGTRLAQPNDSSDYWNHIVDSLNNLYDPIAMDSIRDSIIRTGDTNLINLMNYYLSMSNDSGQGLKKANAPSPITSTADGNLYIDVYPNPNNGTFTVRVSATGNYHIQIDDVLGRNVYATDIVNNSQTNINLGNSPPGNYFVEIACNGVLYHKKLTIVR